MDHLHWSRDPSDLDELHHPVIVAAFTGWNDAGDAATLAVRTLIESSGARPLAEVDPEPFTDFATIRPQVRLDAERRREILWPTVGIWAASLPGADVVFILGPEPSLRWRSFCAQIIGIAERVQSPLVLAVGALLADVPHSRPVQLMGVTSDNELMERFELQPSRYEGPTGIIGVLQAAASEAGIPAASLWAAIPGYASQISSPKAATALVHRTCAMLGTPVPQSSLGTDSIAYENRLAAMINEDQELALYVARLEALADELSHSEDEDGPLDSDQLDSPPLVDDPDVLVSEVERFLREQKND
jgi:proteasome assembly chaperone (PAC2) family protein